MARTKKGGESPKSDKSPKHAAPETEVKITNKKGLGFYIRACRNFLEGIEAKEGVEAKAPVKAITVSALGNAISYAVAVAARLEKEKVGKITKVETNYPGMQNGSFERGVAQIKININRVGPCFTGAAGRRRDR